MMQEPSIPQERHNLQRLEAALILCIVFGLPISFLVGHSNGYNVGRKSGRFDFYYVRPEQKYGVNELSDWLKNWEWIKPYQDGVFDCSEMSAYLEWKLENEGWQTDIILGNSPSGSGRHAWLLVETSEGKYMPVESTNISVVLWESPYFDNYFKYDHSFETIQDALEYSETEFDWWKS